MRAYTDILETAKKVYEATAKEAIKSLKAPADGETGESVTINGYNISKLPASADFAYEAVKDGKGEKFYSVDAVLSHVE